MAIHTDLTDVYTALDNVLADAATAADPDASADDISTVTKIATYLKNRRSLLSEIVGAKADPATFTYADNDGDAGDVEILDHLG